MNHIPRGSFIFRHPAHFNIQVRHFDSTTTSLSLTKMFEVPGAKRYVGVIDTAPRALNIHNKSLNS